MSVSAIPKDRASWEQLGANLRPEGRALIDGRAQPAQDGRTFDDISPIDGAVICQVARGGAADVNRAVAAARRTFEDGVWRRTEPRERKRVLRRFAEAIRADTARLALLETLDVGKPISNSVSVDVANCADCIEYYARVRRQALRRGRPDRPQRPRARPARAARRGRRHRAVELPADHQLPGSSARRCSPAIRVVLKPAEQSPLSGHPPGGAGARGRRAAGRLQRRARLRRGSRQGPRAAPDVDMVTFTGSTEVGKLMLRYAGRVQPEARGPRMRRQDARRWCSRDADLGAPRHRYRLGHLLQQRRDLPRRLAAHRARERQGRAARGAAARHCDHHARSSAGSRHADGRAHR